jgi:hypothetical protein
MIEAKVVAPDIVDMRLKNNIYQLVTKVLHDFK